MSQKVEQLANEIVSLTEPGEKEIGLFLVCARSAAGLENSEEGSGNFPYKLAEMWRAAEGWIEETAKVNPKLAFDQTLRLCLLPKSADAKQENVNRWIRSEAPLLLAKRSLREPFRRYLSSKGSMELFLRLFEYVDFDMGKITSREEALADAECFLAITTMYLGTKLKTISDDSLSREMDKIAREKLKDNHTSEVVRDYRIEGDTDWMIDELEPFLAPKAST